MNQIKICPICNTENPQAANFCRKCRYEFPEETKNGLSLRPEIKYFRIRELQYVVGSTIHIEWDVDNYTKIELAGEDVTLYKSVEILVEKAVDMPLLAINDYDQTQQTIRIMPNASPVIRRFSSSHPNLKAGKTAKLSWNIYYAKKVLLQTPFGENDVTTISEYEVSPDSDTEYTIIAYSVDENVSVSKTLSLHVLRDIVINDFSSNRSHVLESQPVELKWNIENAEKIILYPNDIDVTRQYSVKLIPNRSIMYRIVASNAISIKEQILSISVRPLPRFDVKVSDSLSRLTMPSCKMDFTHMMNSIKEIQLDKWMLSPEEQVVAKRIWSKGLFVKIKKMFLKRIKI